ncbi:hypothetical protein IAT38_005289 [Cryptococcus sp. DSM 104549]
MQNLDNRLSSFSAILKPKTKAKRAFPLSPSSHPHLTPRALADAGFYHTPGPDEAAWDNCTCFLCNLELGGWDEEDDPFEEHAKRAGCAWAEMVCAVKIEKRKRDQGKGKYSTVYDTPDALPQSAESIEVRIQTFKKWWPHKQKAGWLPSVKALASAGFVYNPSTDSKDSVICPYCEYGVEGWEATDDPWTIHQSKVPDCHFFRAELKETAPAVPEKTSKPAGRPKKSEVAKKSKRGTTVAPAPAPEPEPEASEAEVEAEEPAASQVYAAAGRRATRPRATTAKTKGGRGKKKAETVEPEPEAVEEAEVEMEVAETVEEAELEVEVEEPVKKPRGKGKAAAKAKPRATTTAKGKGKGKKKAVVEEEAETGEKAESQAESEVPTESEAEVEPVPEPVPESEAETEAQPTPRPTTKPSAKAAKPSSQALRPASQRSQPSKLSSQSSKPLPSLPPPSSTPAKSPSPTSAPRPLSQLDRFANIPPSSPVPTPRSKATLRSAQPGRPSPHTVNLPREALDTSVTRGALQARKVVDDLFSSPLLPTPKAAAPSPARSPTPRAPSPAPPAAEEAARQGPVVLTEEQKKMTVEDLVRAEMRRGYETLSREGADMIEKFMEQTRKDRMKIEAL